MSTCGCVCHRVGLFGLMCCPCTRTALDEFVNGKPSESAIPVGAANSATPSATPEPLKPQHYHQHIDGTYTPCDCTGAAGCTEMQRQESVLDKPSASLAPGGETKPETVADPMFSTSRENPASAHPFADSPGKPAEPEFVRARFGHDEVTMDLADFKKILAKGKAQVAELASLRAQLQEAQKERYELQQLIDLQHTRTKVVDEAWRIRHGKKNCIPDLGELIDWMWGECKVLAEATAQAEADAETAEAEADALRDALRLCLKELRRVPADGYRGWREAHDSAAALLEGKK